MLGRAMRAVRLEALDSLVRLAWRSACAECQRLQARLSKWRWSGELSQGKRAKSAHDSEVRFQPENLANPARDLSAERQGRYDLRRLCRRRLGKTECLVQTRGADHAHAARQKRGVYLAHAKKDSSEERRGRCELRRYGRRAL